MRNKRGFRNGSADAQTALWGLLISCLILLGAAGLHSYWRNTSPQRHVRITVVKMDVAGSRGGVGYKIFTRDKEYELLNANDYGKFEPGRTYDVDISGINSDYIQRFNFEVTE